MKKHRVSSGNRGGTRWHRPRQEEWTARHADLSDFDLRSHRHAGAGARHSYRQLLHALRQSHAYGRRECHRRTGRHGRGAAVLFGHGRDHDFDSFAGEGGRPYRGAARYLWRRDQVPFAVAAEAGDRNDIRRHQRHRAARARDPAQHKAPAHRVADESQRAGRRSGKNCGAGAQARPDHDHRFDLCHAHQLPSGGVGHRSGVAFGDKIFWRTFRHHLRHRHRTTRFDRADPSHAHHARLLHGSARRVSAAARDQDAGRPGRAPERKARCGLPSF